MELVHMGLQGSALIVIVLLVRALFGRHLPKAVLPVLWIIVLARLLIPLSIASPLSAWTLAGTSLADDSVARPVAVEAVIDNGVLPLEAPASDASTAGAPATFASASAPLSSPVGIQPGKEAASPTIVPDTAVPSKPSILAEAWEALGALPAWQVIWVSGTIVCLLAAAVLYLGLTCAFHLAVPVDDPFAKTWLHAHPLRRRVRIRTCERVRTPMTYGLLRPTILVPPDFDWTDRVSAGLMLEHELVHIRRFDVAFKALLVVAVCLHWFNPLVWAMYVLANRDLELSCDERVLRRLNARGRTAYATALIDAAECASGLLPAAVGFGKSDLSRRVRAIVRPDRPRLAATAAASLLVVAATTAFATTGVLPQDRPGVVSYDATALGALPLPGTEPLELDLDGYRAVVTPRYALVLPDAQVGDGFSWSFDDQASYTATHETEAQGSVTATAGNILTVTGALDAFGQPVSFVVYTQSSNEYKYWSGPCPLGDDYAYQRLDTTGVYAATNDGSTPEAHGLQRLVSTNGYAYPQRENGGTRIMAPRYSVFVPDDALPEGWSFAYSSGDLALELRIYESPEARAADSPVATIANDMYYPSADGPEASTRVAVDISAPVSYCDLALRSLGPTFELGDQDPQWASSVEQAQVWASRVSTDISQASARATAITQDLWRVEMPLYTFDIPEAWRGRVSVSPSPNGELSVYPNGHPELPLIKIMTSNVSGFREGGEISGAIVYSAEDGRGHVVAEYAENYAWAARGGEWRTKTLGILFPGDDVAREVIDLSTGGAYTLEELEAADSFDGLDGFDYAIQIARTNIHVNMTQELAQY